MSAIRSRNTAPEIFVRKALHALGYRYRLHPKALPGKPDIVLPKYRAIILVHGCFWHNHGCRLFKLPKTRVDFWKAKLESNVLRDLLTETRLTDLNWRIAVVWECSLKGKTRIPKIELTEKLSEWLQSDESNFSITAQVSDSDYPTQGVL